MDGHLSDLLRLLNNGQKSDSFSAHFKQNFNDTRSRTDLRKYMSFELLKHIKLIGAMKKKHQTKLQSRYGRMFNYP